MSSAAVIAVKPPGPWSASRLVVLFSSLLVCLASGTNYVYSAWAPQLGAKLKITHTQLNILALSGNVGVYSSGPIWGRIVDKRGPRIPFIGAFVFLFVGYSGIKWFFDNGLSEGETTISGLAFAVMIVCSWMTGSGGNGGLTGSVNSTAKSFPDKMRATVTGIVIGGFGLSAFLFSTMAHVAYAGNTSAFLEILAFGTALPMVLGFFFVRPIPLPVAIDDSNPSGGRSTSIEVTSSSTPLMEDHDARTRLLSGDRDMEMDESESELEHGRQERVRRSASRSSRLSMADVELPNVFGSALWRSSDFWLLFTMLSLLSGTGLMYINNVGAMSQTLYAKGSTKYDEVEAAQWQAMQVSAISVMNFLGRIIIGITSDTIKNRLKLPRSYCLVLVSFGVFLSQVTAANVNEIGGLWLASSILGLSYGSVFSLFPLMTIEWFGLPHFSENWGYCSLAPMIAGNIFMIIFGRNLDAHEAKSSLPQPSTPITTPTNSNLEADIPKCLDGKQCYVAALYLTIGMTFICILLSIWAAWRDKRRLNGDGKGNGKRIGRYRSLSGECLIE